LNNKYVIITPAYNEEDAIEITIKSVIRQSILPCKWVIVDDGSTDSTAEIVKRYEAEYDFIEYHSRERIAGQSYYGSNVYAISQGVEQVKGMDYDFLAILDADIDLCGNYYEEIFRRFQCNLELGIATGTYVEEIGGQFLEAVIDRRSTPKAIQVFRKECFEKIGGFIPLKNGGEDSCAEIMARMYGWQTWSFPEIKVVHLKPVGTGDGRGVLQGRFRLGMTDYCLATHPVFMLAKCLRRTVKEKPYVSSGVCRFAGFLKGYIVREPRQIPTSVRVHVRREQLNRLMAVVGAGERLWTPVVPVGEEG